MANGKDIFWPDKVYLDNYVPSFLTEYKELSVLYNVQTEEVDKMINALYQSFYNTFVNYTDDAGLQLFEQMFNLHPNTKNLDDRRMAILSLINKSLPYTEVGLRDLLGGLLGEKNYELVIDYNNYTLKIKLGVAARYQYNTVSELFRDIIPANISCEITLLYNKYKTVGRLTYAECATKTFTQLRNDLLVDEE